jgi:hypothetical protein
LPRRTNSSGALLLLLAGLARADVPSTRIMLYGGASAPTGALGAHYDIGGVVGVEAGWTPGWLGFVWTWQYSHFNASADQNPVGSLKLWDIGAAVRARMGFRGEIPAFGYVQLGASIVRASSTIPPDDDTAFFGPRFGAGAEIDVGAFIFGIGADYGLLAGGPSGLQIVLKIGAGTRSGG